MNADAHAVHGLLHFAAEIVPTDVSPSTTVTPEVISLPRASGPRDIPMALCQALAVHFGVPFWRDNVRDDVEALLARQPPLNLCTICQFDEAVVSDGAANPHAAPPHATRRACPWR